MTATALLDTTKLIVGTSGAGKTVTMKGEVERLLDQRRHLVLFDPTGASSGLRANAAGDGPGYDIPIFGGRLGELPIGPDDGDIVAGIVVDQRVSAIVDLSDPDRFADEADMRVFALAFLQRLRRKPPGNFHLVLDEADDFCPQTPPDDVAYTLVRQIRWFAKKGRLPGYVLTLVTQRPADIDKSVISQAQTIVVHRLIAPQDRKAVDAYLAANGDKGTRETVMGSLPGLAIGERWIYSPGLQLLERGISPSLRTYDSSRTPAPGEMRSAPPIGQLDLTAIRAALSPAARSADALPGPFDGFQAGEAAVEAIAARDRRLAALDRELAQEREHRHAIATIGQAAHSALLDLGNRALEQAVALNDALRALLDLQPVDADLHSPDAVSTEPDARAPDCISGVRASSGQGAAAGGRPPAAAAPAFRGRKPLATLVAIHPAGLTEPQWALLAGYTRSGGTWGTYKGQLRAAGLIVQDGDLWRATDAGVAAIGAPPAPLPAPGKDLARFWGDRVPGGRKLVDVLLKRWPHYITRDSLAADVGMAAGGGSFNTYLGRLRGNGLLQEQGKRVRLAPAIMEGGAAK